MPCPAPIVNFEGVGNVSGASPPDTEGDIGPNHYMQWVNLAFRIYNRDGTPASSITQGYQLFTGQSVCGSPSGNGGDPIVLYDQFANRWIASQLAYPNYPNGPFYQCVAYSSTSDPTGTWCAYQYVAHATKPERLSEVRRLADPARLHDHRQPVPRAAATRGQASASSRSSATR